MAHRFSMLPLQFHVPVAQTSLDQSPHPVKHSVHLIEQVLCLLHLLDSDD